MAITMWKEQPPVLHYQNFRPTHTLTSVHSYSLKGIIYFFLSFIFVHLSIASSCYRSGLALWRFSLHHIFIVLTQMMGKFNFQRKSKNKLEPCSYINTSNILYCIGLLLRIFHTSFAGFSEVFYAYLLCNCFTSFLIKALHVDFIWRYTILLD